MHHSLIRRVPLFTRLPDAEIAALADSLVEKTFPAGAVLFREGEQGDRFYILAEGQIAIIKSLGTPEEMLLNLSGPGEFIGEMSLFSQDGLRTASVRAATEVRLLELSRGVFESLLSRQPVLVYDMLKLLSQRLLEANDHTVNSLLQKNDQLARAYTELQEAQAQIIEKELMDRELRQARELQQLMLPAVLPRLTGYDLGARMVPARMIGGDFYDVIPLDADRIGLAVGDVAGKGVPAAMFMSLACSLLRSEARLHVSPVQVLELLNRRLRAANPKGLFVTVLYGVLHLSQGVFVYARAGHEVPMFWDRDGSPLPTQEEIGQPLGLFSRPAIDTQVLHLPPGSTLLIYTDGVTEAQNPDRDFFGEECIRHFMPELMHLPAQELCDQLEAWLSNYYGGESRSDDVTLMALKTLP